MSVNNTVEVALKFSANLIIPPKQVLYNHFEVLDQILLRPWRERPEWLPQPYNHVCKDVLGG